MRAIWKVKKIEMEKKKIWCSRKNRVFLRLHRTTQSSNDALCAAFASFASAISNGCLLWFLACYFRLQNYDYYKLAMGCLFSCGVYECVSEYVSFRLQSVTVYGQNTKCISLLRFEFLLSQRIRLCISFHLDLIKFVRAHTDTYSHTTNGPIEAIKMENSCRQQ